MSNLIDKRNRIRQAVPHLASASGSIASFQTDMRSPLEEIKIHFNPVQSGTGTPSPTNVRPLSGWTGLTIGQGVEQLIDPGQIIRKDGYIVEYGGAITTSTTSGISENLFAIDSGDGKQFTITGLGLRAIALYDANGDYISRTPAEDPPITFSANASTKFIRLQYRLATFDPSSILLVEGTSPGTISNQIPVSWSELGTVYGGYVNEDGEVWATYTWFVPTAWDNQWSFGFYPTYNRVVFNRSTIPYPKIDGNILANYAKYGTASIAWNTFIGSTGNILLYVPTEITSSSAFIDYVAENPLTYCYELATPVLVGTISPIQLKSLVGQNNIWSSANGNVDVKYWKH